MTTEAPKQFFTHPSNLLQLRKLAQELRALPDGTVSPDGLVHNIAQILDLMISNAEKFDKFCVTNIEWIGNSFLSEVSGYSEQPNDRREAALRSIFTSAYRFICELDFAQPADPSFELRRIMSFVHDNLERFSGTDRQQLVFAAYAMPAQVAKRLINHPSIGDYRKFADTVESARNLKDEWDTDTSRRQERLDALDQNLKRVTSAYNFVGLVNGFQALHEKKESERGFAFIWLVVIALLMVVAPVGQIAFVVTKLDTIDSHKLTLAYTLPTIVAVELILLYFFRVVLSHFRSVKAQLLQLDLRIALCQFIESYAEYASRVKAQDSSALSKFEALVFSGLMPDETGIPSTFDGAEQIASLIRSVRGGGGKTDA